MTVFKEKGMMGLKLLIISRGYSQELLAREMGISKFSLNKKLNGKSRLTVAEVVKLVEMLKIESPEDYFFRLEDTER